ncbi:MAG: ABC transporter permease [Actinomycetota bacterium]|nr:ABC transporter permease [Actinomycetota bacterium]
MSRPELPLSSLTRPGGRPEERSWPARERLGGDRNLRPPLLGAVAAQTRLELALLLRSGESLLVTLGIPLGFLVFFSLVDDVLPTGGRPAVDFLVPGVLAVSVISTGLVSLAIQTAFERKYGVLKLLGGSPLPRWGLLVSKALAVLGVLMVQTGLVVVVARSGLNWRQQGGIAPLLVALALGALCFSAIGLLMAGTLRAEGTLALANGLFLLLLLISGLVFDSAALPGPLASLGQALPSGALGTALRAALEGSGRFAAGPLAVLMAWGAGAVALAAHSFRWEP